MAASAAAAAALEAAPVAALAAAPVQALLLKYDTSASAAVPAAQLDRPTGDDVD